MRFRVIIKRGLLLTATVAVMIGGVACSQKKEDDKSTKGNVEQAEETKEDDSIKMLDVSSDELADLYQKEDKEVESISASYAIHVDDYDELVNFSNYSFVGKVNKIAGVQMDSERQKEAGMSGHPYTIYHVSVMKNIKGDLEEGKEIRIAKQGGLNEDLGTFELMEDDILPEVDGYYIFNAVVERDGSLEVGGKNSTIEVDKDMKDKVIQEFLDVKQDKKKEAALKPSISKLNPDKIKVK